MTGLRFTTILICTILSMLDGFDVLVMSFTASGVAREWGLSGAQLGVLLSSALVGMALGSVLVAPLADHIGRRTIIVLCLSAIAVSLLLSSFSRNLSELAFFRAITGVGVGGMLASINVVTAEFATERGRATAVSLQATGYPIGATLGGLATALLIPKYGWRAAFLFGSICSAVMLIIVVVRLPESPDFLASKGTPWARAKLDELRKRLALPTAEIVATAVPSATRRRPLVIELFSSQLRSPTLLIWSAFFFVMLSVYFVLSWTPRLLVSAGLSEQAAIGGGVLLNLGGILGGLSFAWLARRRDPREVALMFLAMFAVLTAMFGTVSGALAVAYVLAGVLGIFLFGAMVGLYVIVPAIYPTAVRMTGMGYALGVGRTGAIVAPFLAGLLIDSGWSPSALYHAFSLPLLGAIGALLLRRKQGGSVERALRE